MTGLSLVTLILYVMVPFRIESWSFLCIETARQSDWDGIIACHRGFLVATTWNYQKGSIGAHKLEPERFNRNRALSVHATVSVLNRSFAVFYCITSIWKLI